jgi:DNA-binding GntR family transcriptional regulator
MCTKFKQKKRKIVAKGLRRGAKATPDLDEAVYRRISSALMEGKLKAGSKLAEHKLAEALEVSRERVRKALHRLAAERRIEIIPNRGAWVPRPSAHEIKAVYEAHRVLESGVLMRLCQSVTEEMLAKLEAHLDQERDAAVQGDRPRSVQLSGRFHILLVDMLDNDELSRFIRDLLSRSSIMVSLYEQANQSACGVDEHAEIVAALRARDPERAIALSHSHFAHVEHRLNLQDAVSAPQDFASIFAS